MLIYAIKSRECLKSILCQSCAMEQNQILQLHSCNIYVILSIGSNRVTGWLAFILRYIEDGGDADEKDERLQGL